MYFLTGWPRRLLCPLRSEEQPFHLQPSQHRLYFAVLAHTQLSVWFSRVAQVVLIMKPRGAFMEYQNVMFMGWWWSGSID
ncbi:hypothetical protein AOLI_G00200820 [Acnodon oligacanthus]